MEKCKKLSNRKNFLLQIIYFWVIGNEVPTKDWAMGSGDSVAPSVTEESEPKSY